MKIGVCCPARKAARAAATGCDYMELGFGEVARMSEGQFARAESALQSAGLRAEAMNSFLPASLGLCGPALDRPALEDYLAQGFARAKRLGAEIVVFGSAGARRLPEGMAKPEGWAILAPWLRLAGDRAAERDITIAIEPLRRAECNAVNTIEEGLALQKLTNHNNVKLLADFYHMAENGEPAEAILPAEPALVHCHIARPGARVWPMPNDGYDYGPFFRALRQLHYAGRVSIEAPPPKPTAKLAVSVGYLRGLAGHYAATSS